jgi:hypothetical protein
MIDAERRRLADALHVRERAQSVGGSVDVAPRPSGGVVVRFSLPLGPGCAARPS